MATWALEIDIGRMNFTQFPWLQCAETLATHDMRTEITKKNFSAIMTEVAVLQYGMSIV